MMRAHYIGLGRDFASHEAVNHTEKEYVRGDVTINTVEGYYFDLQARHEGRLTDEQFVGLVLRWVLSKFIDNCEGKKIFKKAGRHNRCGPIIILKQKGLEGFGVQSL